MPSAAPISGFGVVRVDTVSLGGTVKERVMATRRGVDCSGVVDMFVQRLRADWIEVLVCTRHRQPRGLPVAMLLPGW